MKKNVLSTLCSACALCSMLLTISVNVYADDMEDKEIVVDGSRLTYENSSQGSTSDQMSRGKYLMTGDSIITKTGNGRIYTYGQTTANFDVDYVAVLVYVDRYDESDGLWGQIDAHAKDARDTYYVVSTKTLKVDRGYFYRVHCDHLAGNKGELYDDAISYTDGIWIP